MTTSNKENNKPNVEFNRRKILARYQKRGRKAKKGLFTTITRMRLLGEIPEGKEESHSEDEVLTLKNIEPLKQKTSWRYLVRERVKTALIDLELFITMCDTYSEKEVLTPENIEPLLTALLFHPILDRDKPDLKKAEIAKLFINYGFSYLTRMQPKQVNRATQQSIEIALDTANFLVEFFRSPDEGRYVSKVLFDKPQN